jgi:hypothetical protein
MKVTVYRHAALTGSLLGDADADPAATGNWPDRRGISCTRDPRGPGYEPRWRVDLVYSYFPRLAHRLNRNEGVAVLLASRAPRSFSYRDVRQYRRRKRWLS